MGEVIQLGIEKDGECLSVWRMLRGDSVFELKSC